MPRDQGIPGIQLGERQLQFGPQAALGPGQGLAILEPGAQQFDLRRGTLALGPGFGQFGGNGIPPDLKRLAVEPRENLPGLHVHQRFGEHLDNRTAGAGGHIGHIGRGDLAWPLNAGDQGAAADHLGPETRQRLNGGSGLARAAGMVATRPSVATPATQTSFRFAPETIMRTVYHCLTRAHVKACKSSGIPVTNPRQANTVNACAAG